MTAWHQGAGGPALVVVEVEGVKIGDDFGRVEVGAWGSADTGQPWTTLGGASDDYTVNGGVGGHVHDSVNVARHSLIGGNFGDVDVSADIFAGVVPTGAPIQVGLVVRWIDGSNFYFARLFLLDSDTALINIVATVGGVEVGTANIAVPDVASSSTRIGMRFQVTSSLLRARAWNADTTEPSSWLVELTHSGLSAGQVGVRSQLQVGNTNTLPVTLAFDRFRCTTPQWTAIRPLHVAGMDVDMAGRQGELDRTDNAALQLVVDNSSGDYTPGSAQAAYPLTQGQRIRVKETVGHRSFDLFTGTLQQPEAVYGTTANEAVVAVSAVDLFGELQANGRTFISTLGEWIRDAGGDALVGYWPLGDGAGATQAEPAVITQGPLTFERRTDLDAAGAAPTGALLSFGAGGSPAMDDIGAVQFNPIVSDTTILARDRLVQRTLTGVDLTAVEALAVSLWYRPTEDFTGDWQAMVARDNSSTNSFTLQTFGPDWIAFGQTTAGFEQLDGSAVRHDAWQLLTIHLVCATGLVSLWIDEAQFTVSLGGASTGDLDSILVDAGPPGSAACHLQLYAGDLAVVNRQSHLDQYAQGADWQTGGLRFQRTDQRFLTVLRYAGITGGQADPGTVWMQPAALAGKTVTNVIDEAVRTEQGRAFIDGSGTPTFHSRIHTRYNV